MQKAGWLGVEGTHEICRVDLHPSLVGDTQAKFHAMPDGHAVFENVPSSMLQSMSAWCVLSVGVRRSCGWRAKLVSWDCVMLVGLLQAWRRFLFLLDSMALVLGAKSAAVVPRVSTCREVCVISLSTFTIPVCRWIASETNPAVEPSRSKRYRPRMHSDVDQCETSTTGLTADLELFTVLPAEAARVTGEEVQPRKPSRVRSSTDETYTCQVSTNTYP